MMKVWLATETIRKDAKNEFGGYDYADLVGTLEAIKPLLTEHDLFPQQSYDGTREEVVTRIWHAPTGEWMESRIRLLLPGEKEKGKSRQQSWSGCYTMARRYGLWSVCALVADDGLDDDARQHEPEKRQPPKTQARAQTKTTTKKDPPARKEAAKPATKKEAVEPVDNENRLKAATWLNERMEELRAATTPFELEVVFTQHEKAFERLKKYTDLHTAWLEDLFEALARLAGESDDPDVFELLLETAEQSIHQLRVFSPSHMSRFSKLRPVPAEDGELEDA